MEDPWQGLTLEEIAMLEHEDGTDKELADAEGGAPDDFSLATTPIEALAPGCVRISQWNGPWVSWATVSNNCGYRVRVKLIFAWGLDTGCIHLEPGWKATRGVGTPAAYVKRIETC